MKTWLSTTIALLFFVVPAWAAHAPLEGFGADTPGGNGKPVYHITNLRDAKTNPPAGSLRHAISQGHRHIVFDVGGTITLQDNIEICQSFITVDGFSAPAPGITLTGRGIGVRGICKGKPTNTSPVTGHDVIIQGIRVRDAGTAGSSTDCFRVAAGAYNVVLDHVSGDGCADGVADITGNNISAAGGPETHDVTVSWSVFGPTQDGKRTMLVKYGVSRLSLHHNLFVLGQTRNPEVTRETDAVDHDTTVDFRNNVVWGWGPGTGTRIHGGATGNVVANLYASPNSGHSDQEQGLLFCGILPAPRQHCPTMAANGFAAGNVSLDGFDFNGGAGSPLPAAPVTTQQDACQAAELVLEHAGAPHDDGTDAALKAHVILTGCQSDESLPPTPPATPAPPLPPPPSSAGGSGSPPPPPAAKATLIIAPSVATVSPGAKLQLRALYDPDGSGPQPPREVSFDASWTTSNPDVADVDQRGEAEGRTPGTVLVAAEYLSNSATATLTVTVTAR